MSKSVMFLTEPESELLERMLKWATGGFDRTIDRIKEALKIKGSSCFLITHVADIKFLFLSE